MYIVVFVKQQLDAGHEFAFQGHCHKRQRLCAPGEHVIFQNQHVTMMSSNMTNECGRWHALLKYGLSNALRRLQEVALSRSVQLPTTADADC
jgi:hypothetical protein